MRQECIQAVQQAAQRMLTAREIQNIEDRIYRNMRSIARDDTMSWRQLSESERLYRAAQLASEELQREAALNKRRVALTIAARQRLDKFINSYQGADGKLGALNRTIAFNADGKSNFLSVESRTKATRDYALSQLQEAFEAVDPRFLVCLKMKRAYVTWYMKCGGKILAMLKQETVLRRGEKLQSCCAAGLMMLVGTLAISKTGGSLNIILWKRLGQYQG